MMLVIEHGQLRAEGIRRLVLLLGCVWLPACSFPSVVGLSKGHLPAESVQLDTATLPVPAKRPVPPPLQAAEPAYSVVVKDVPVSELLFSLARDAELELDLQVSADKRVTINALERPLSEILNRIAVQSELRFTLRGQNLIIQDDEPFWKNYGVDYVNISRDSQGEVGVATQISTSGGSVGEAQQPDDEQGNLSSTTVKNSSNNDFWSSLESNLATLLTQGEKRSASNKPQDQDPVIVAPLAGVVTVFGNQRQHDEIQRYLEQLMNNAQRQVLIEMTIVEVKLSDDFQAGVDWQRVSGSDGFTVQTDLLGPNLQVSPFVALSYEDPDPGSSSLSSTVRLLQQFGDTRVLSSPKIMALNNQTALLKVVNESVYFTVELDIREASADIPERRTFTSQVHTVPVGLILSVTPQISQEGFVSLNIRPTISRITGFAVDPAPRLSGADFDNLIPQIQVREIESLLQVMNGRTVVLGGLMQNERESQQDGVPGLSRLPKIGKLFSYNRDRLVKTELVIFLKPTIVQGAAGGSAAPRIGDYYDYSGAVTMPAAKRNQQAIRPW